jgi:hypothetical protein
MLRAKILNLFKEYEPEVREVLARVIEAEWGKLSYKKPSGIIEEIRDIIDAEARLSDREA